MIIYVPAARYGCGNVNIEGGTLKSFRASMAGRAVGQFHVF